MRFLRLLVAALVAWLSFAPAVAPSPLPDSTVAAYTYDASGHVSPAIRAATERGPPTAGDQDGIYNAADRLSRGASARPDGPTPRAATTYNDAVRLAEVAQPTGTTQEQARRSGGESSSLTRAGVAAKSADEALAGVDDVLGGLSKGRSGGVRSVGSDAELDEVYGTLTRGGTPIDVPGYKGSWIERSDRIRVGIRDASKSGGRTIDIRYPDGTIRKVHIE